MGRQQSLESQGSGNTHGTRKAITTLRSSGNLSEVHGNPL